LTAESHLNRLNESTSSFLYTSYVSLFSVALINYTHVH